MTLSGGGGSGATASALANPNFSIAATRGVQLGASGGTLYQTGGSTLTVAGNVTGSAGGALTKTGAGTLVLNGANTYNGATNVNTGKLRIAQSMRSSSALVVANGARAEVTPRSAGAAKVLQVGTLTVNATATLDLNDNDLVVNTGSFTAIRALVTAGLGNPAGPGIVSSTATGSQVLALFDNALLPTPLTSWNGGTIPASAIVGKYTYFGDVNMDGQVTGDDYTVVDSNLNTDPPVGLEWLRGDANTDGVVTGDDYTAIDARLGLGVGSPLVPSAIPEPGTFSIIAGGAFAWAARRRRCAGQDASDR
jgi:autotransporter-associated beta strand protein